MSKYFVIFECGVGTVAVEKHLYNYIRENYADCIVSEDAIEKMKNDIARAQDEYLFLHKSAKPVSVELLKNPLTGGSYLSAGRIGATLVKVRKEIC